MLACLSHKYLCHWFTFSKARLLMLLSVTHCNVFSLLKDVVPVLVAYFKGNFLQYFYQNIDILLEEVKTNGFLLNTKMNLW